MIHVKSADEIELMRKAGALVRDTLLYLEEKVCPGMTTKKVDMLAYDFIVKHGGRPSCLGYEGFPASICTSVNDEVVHGIPGNRVLVEGDIVSLDVVAELNGFHGDATRTLPMGKVSEEKLRLIEVCKQSFFEGVSKIVPGARLGDVSAAIQKYVESNGYSVVREMCGHGIGREMHEDPNVLNYGVAGKGVRLTPGMVLAIEPMINQGTRNIEMLDNNWTIVTADGKPSAHYENTVAITEEGYEILTL